ncbi:MAG: sensor histidine kinase [Leadbetterella sp.]
MQSKQHFFIKQRFSNLSRKEIIGILLFSWTMLIVGAFMFSAKLMEENSFSKDIQEKTTIQLNQAAKDLSFVKARVYEVKDRQFKSYSTPTIFPYYIFKDGQLIYWSNNKFIPDYGEVKNIQYEKLLNAYNSNKILKVLKFRKEDGMYMICSIIELTKNYSQGNYYLENTFNKNIFPKQPSEIYIPGAKKGLSIIGTKNKELYETAFKDLSSSDRGFIELWHLIGLHVMLLVGLILLFSYYRILINEKKHRRAFIHLIIGLIFIRVITYFSGIPEAFFTLNGLNNKVETACKIYNLCFLDKLININLLIIFIFNFSFHYLKIQYIKELSKYDSGIQTAVSLALIIGHCIFSYLIFLEIRDFVSDPFYGLNDLLNLDFKKIQFLSVAYLLMMFVTFLIMSQMTTHLFHRIHQNKYHGLFYWLYGYAASIIFYYYISGFSWTIIISGGFFLALYLSNLTYFYQNFRFQTLIYYLAAASCFASIMVKSLHDESIESGIENRLAFAKNYLNENDLQAEGLLYDLQSKIPKDTQIVQALKKNFFGIEVVNQVIKDKLLDIYFDSYNVKIQVFDSKGSPWMLLDSIKDFNEYQVNVLSEGAATKFPHVYLLKKNTERSKKYVSISEIKEGNTYLGSIGLELQLKENADFGSSSDFLQNKTFGQNPDAKNYSYALYNKAGILLQNNGVYNYNMNFSPKFLKDKSLYTVGARHNQYIHQAYKDSDGKILVVSESNTWIKNILANFSFLFLLSLVGISVLIVFFAIFFTKGNIRMEFSTKIQLYLNGALLIPLLVLIAITLNLIRTSLVGIQDNALTDNAKNIGSTIQIYYDDLINGKSSQAFFENQLSNLAKSRKIDLNVFTNDGTLSFTSRPILYQSGLYSNKINPRVYMELIDLKANETIKTETLGNLEYKSAYVRIKDRNNRPMGIMSIPFFDAKNNLDAQIKSVVSTLLIIFMGLFVILLVTSFFTSTSLTSPLRIISQKLKRTNLENQNEEIEWNSNDEIGMLTKAYNNMIKKLEESKQALSQSEKQTAWREMAKQVAHEIKNPLTPMKLSIQQLQRTLSSDNIEQKNRIERALNSLTAQIDNINEIANSFSEFAKMPVPKSEKFDIVSTAQKTVDLYMVSHNIKIDFEAKQKQITVIGDRMFFSRVITNLILNGIQAVPPVRQPEISVSVYLSDEANSAIVAIKDNGSGIPEDIHQKIFITNFSTKVGGSGLGLAMAKKGIEHAGGNIWFDTIEDEGTTFFIDLPRST